MILPHKTIERLIQYRRLLQKYRYADDSYIFSHDLARLLQIKPEQVRRDIMLVGGTGSQRKGYNVIKLLDAINKILTIERKQNAALIGINSLGDNVTNYFNNNNENIKIIASFDFNPINNANSEIKCYHIMELNNIIQKENISIAILAVSPDDVESVTQLLIAAGIKGILNFTSVKLELPEDIFLEEFDIITSIEKIAFFSK